MPPRAFRRSLLAVLVLLGVGGICHAGENFLGRMLDYYRNRPYPVDHFAPGNYGYNLDDQSRGYFGGGRYTEYYNYGRGGGFSNLANFPSAPPGPAWLYDNRNWIGTQPVRPFANPGLSRPSGVRVVPPGSALLTVEVPPNAIVWLEDRPMQQTGPTREYVSPQLEPGVSYTYTVRARWNDGQRELEQIQHVQVQAGQARQVTFPGAAPRTLPAGFGE